MILLLYCNTGSTFHRHNAVQVGTNSTVVVLVLVARGIKVEETQSPLTPCQPFIATRGPSYSCIWLARWWNSTSEGRCWTQRMIKTQRVYRTGSNYSVVVALLLSYCSLWPRICDLPSVQERARHYYTAINLQMAYRWSCVHTLSCCQMISPSHHGSVFTLPRVETYWKHTTGEGARQSTTPVTTGYVLRRQITTTPAWQAAHGTFLYS